MIQFPAHALETHESSDRSQRSQSAAILMDVCFSPDRNGEDAGSRFLMEDVFICPQENGNFTYKLCDECSGDTDRYRRHMLSYILN